MILATNAKLVDTAPNLKRKYLFCNSYDLIRCKMRHYIESTAVVQWVLLSIFEYVKSVDTKDVQSVSTCKTVSQEEQVDTLA